MIKNDLIYFIIFMTPFLLFAVPLIVDGARLYIKMDEMINNKYKGNR